MTAASSAPLPVPVRRRSLSARVATWAITLYQATRQGRVSPCRFWPTCSDYALEAIERHGAGRGLWLTTRRLLRCRPFGPSGPDLVPE